MIKKINTHDFPHRIIVLGCVTIFIIFAIVAVGYSRVNHLAGTAQFGIKEAETLTLPLGISSISDSDASAGLAIKYGANVAATGDVKLTTNTATIVVRARGVQCKGQPLMNLSIDGSSVPAIGVGTNTWTDYTVTQALASGRHEISIAQINSATYNGCKRALFIDKITFISKDVAKTSPLAPNKAPPASTKTTPTLTFPSPPIPKKSPSASTNTPSVPTPPTPASTPRSPAPTMTPPPPTPPPPSGYPDTSNTGVPAGVTLTPSGSITITQDGTVIDGQDITGTVEVRANNVTIKRSRIRDSTYYLVRIFDGIQGTLIQDVEVDGKGTSYNGITGAGTFERVNVHGVENGVSPYSDSVVKYSYIHDLANTGQPHYDGIEINGGVTNITIRGNSISIPDDTGTINVNNYFGPVSNITIDNNKLYGGTYTLYVDGRFSGGPITGVSVTNNRFGTSQYGYAQIGNTTISQSGNVDDKTGQLINL